MMQANQPQRLLCCAASSPLATLANRNGDRLTTCWATTPGVLSKYRSTKSLFDLNFLLRRSSLDRKRIEYVMQMRN